jgi:hypothetical protein
MEIILPYTGDGLTVDVWLKDFFKVDHKIVSGDSRTDGGLQLADMVAGVIRNRVIDLWRLDYR